MLIDQLRAKVKLVRRRSKTVTVQAISDSLTLQEKVLAVVFYRVLRSKQTLAEDVIKAWAEGKASNDRKVNVYKKVISWLLNGKDIKKATPGTCTITHQFEQLPQTSQDNVYKVSHGNYNYIISSCPEFLNEIH